MDEPREDLAKAIFAGGCFWCMDRPFGDLDGVVSVTAGYTGGHRENPTYDEVCSGATGHAEAVQVLFDPNRTSYEELLEVFWRNINPTDPDGQFADRGSQYRSAIFYHDDDQRRLAEASKSRLSKDGPFEASIVTEILPAGPFYRAEEYHQGYCRKEPLRYQLYRMGSGRQRFLDRVWGKSSSEED